MQNNTTVSESDFREQATKDGVTHISTGVAVVRDCKILMARRIADDFLVVCMNYLVVELMKVKQ